MTSFYSEKELKNLKLKSYGKNVLISKKTSLYSPETISIGNNVRIDDFCILSGNIILHNHIHIAPFCGLYGGSDIEMHDFSGLSSRVSVYSESDDFSGKTLTNPCISNTFRGIRKGKITFEKHSIIGTSTIIMPKVTIKEGTSVNAMSLVIKSTNSWGIYSGVPAKFIRGRKKNLLDLEKKFINDYTI